MIAPSAAIRLCCWRSGAARIGGARCSLRRGFAAGNARPSAADALRERNRKIAMYMLSVVVGVGGVSYAAVPLYKAFCQATGFGGTTQVATREKTDRMVPLADSRLITVTFDGMVADTMPWRFRQSQSAVRVVPGETALAFYTASNPTKKHITGVATYNVFPLKAGIYFNKIQCFCFEEQRLKAGEEIDMPVLFFIDPEMLDDPAMDNVSDITLSYTFFKTGEEDAVEEPQVVDEVEEEDEEDVGVTAAGRGWRLGGWWQWLRGRRGVPTATAGDAVPQM
ncbi:cytochrome c oxidase assembly protein CtaG/Cox11-domain-containing protein [Tribonema minus]|uniref:Cytochrome c oxidase assembly protein CtaG/Cox11-domain-containing protein n=1 Tax=Tribonema minus TaxID=303371 RepID=A0A835ZEK6_9STRA|nr:cytochrome c oxidase assembly protein CtaG/Cox11-domain-containing protein [Tribonema minus]